jgi:NAD(P)-dependent dehydrogenase (short-subunit alcohol dehydrogenase family)
VAKNQVVVITGASAGVGRATVREFARHGASIGLIARGRDGLEGARREVEAAGGKALVLPTDVADAAQVEAAAARVEKELGPIDVWVNDAMASVFSRIKQMTAEEFKRVTDVTYLGYVYGTLAALKRMLPRDRGTIVHVGSALAYRSIPLQAAYCAAKHAVLGFFASLRTELLHDHSNVHTVMVQMPALNTPQFGWVKSRLPHKAQPVPPIYQPEVAARAIYYASQHPERREYFVGWSTIKAIYGNKLVPSYADRYLARTGYDSQQHDGPEDPNRANNLWEPVPGDHGAHGSFDDRAREHSLELWATTHRGILAAALGLGIAGLAFAIGRDQPAASRALKGIKKAA